LRDLERINEISHKKPYYFKMSKFQPSQFQYIEKDLKAIEKMGKITDKSNSQNPLVIFSTENFGVFEYREKL
jgi:hypothetical protein